MAGIERPNMNEPRPGAGENPQERLARALELLEQRLAESGSGHPGRAGRSPADEEAKRRRETEADRKFADILKMTDDIQKIGARNNNSFNNLPPDQQAEYDNVNKERRALFETASFAETLRFIEKLQPPTGPEAGGVKTWREWNLKEAMARQEQLLKEANERWGMFKEVKAYMLGIYYDARVKVAEDEKMGRDEYKRPGMGGGTLQELGRIRRAAQQQSWEAGILQTIEAEGRPEFWSDSDYPERQNLQETFRGIVDYVHREGIKLIEAVVKDPEIYPNPDKYPKNGIFQIWKGELIDNTGRPLLNEEGEVIVAEDFDDVRIAIEDERAKNPTVSNRGDYDAWVKFSAGSVKELLAMFPYVVKRAAAYIGSASANPSEASRNLDQEETKLEKAAINFPGLTEKRKRRVRSTLVAHLKLTGADIFSKVVRKDWGPHHHFVENIASACKDDEHWDHFIDAAVLDDDGFTMEALDLYAQKDGEFWRYGRNTATTHKETNDMSLLQQRQQREREGFEEYMMKHRFKPMRMLLNLDEEGRSLGDPNHPAFKRLKDEFDIWDRGERVAIRRSQSRWNEYCAKALHWEKTGEPDDPRKRPQVIFQHPLARSFRPVDFTDEQGRRTTEDEFKSMFELDEKYAAPKNNKLYLSVKRRKVRAALDTAEKIQVAFQDDVTAGGPRHYCKTQKDLVEMQKYVPIASRDEVVPHKTLVRGMLQKLVEHDRRKLHSDSKNMRFKMLYILTKKLGLDIDSPLMGGWSLGAHDTGRAVLLQWINQVPGFKDDLDRRNRIRQESPAADPDLGKNDPAGGDEKTAIAAWEETSRRLVLLVEYLTGKKFPEAYNFPGHDEDDGGGKDQRNNDRPAFGNSWGTVEMNAMTKEYLNGAHSFAEDWGCTVNPWKQLVGLFKGPSEAIFMKMGYKGFIQNPRDPESWVNRHKGTVAINQLWTKGPKEGQGHGLANDGPFSGMYLFRDLNRNLDNFGLPKELKYVLEATKDPEKYYKEMVENGYRAYIEVAAKVISPLKAVMDTIMSSEDSTFGRNPGSAMFLNTMLWYSISKWMDTNWTEVREKFGFALDGDLHLARKFMHTVLSDARLIYNDQQWDEIMLGYTRVKNNDGSIERVVRYEVDNQGKTIRVKHNDDGTIAEKKGPVGGEVFEGLLDAFPDDLRKEIMDNGWLPYGLNTEFPEDLKIALIARMKEAKDPRKAGIIYGELLNMHGQTRGRKQVFR